jgi:hypothetical protein
MVRFEAYAKRRFAGDATDIFSFPVPGIDDDESLKVRRGFLRVTGQEMGGIFLLVLDEVLNLALQQIRVSQSPVKAALVVGGFGQHPFLCDHLQANLPSGVKVLAPPDGWTAVVRGALAKVLSEVSPLVHQISITSRVARKYYGHTKIVPFDRRIHDNKKKYAHALERRNDSNNFRFWHDYHGKYYISVMNWFICKVSFECTYLGIFIHEFRHFREMQSMR